MIVPCGIRLASSLLTFFSEYLINSPLHYFLNKMEILGCIRLLCVYQCCVTNHPKTQWFKQQSFILAHSCMGQLGYSFPVSSPGLSFKFTSGSQMYFLCFSSLMNSGSPGVYQSHGESRSTEIKPKFGNTSQASACFISTDISLTKNKSQSQGQSEEAPITHFTHHEAKASDVAKINVQDMCFYGGECGENEYFPQVILSTHTSTLFIGIPLYVKDILIAVTLSFKNVLPIKAIFN